MRYRIALGALSVALLCSCVPNRPYRLAGVEGGIYDRKFGNQQRPSEKWMAVPGRDYRLSFVEFDEKGDFWDRAQLAIAGTEIKRAPKPVLLVVFIHGWHHNAADRGDTRNPGDVETFKCLLSQLAVSEPARDLEVHGVYIGWRGRTLPGPLDYLTFWKRKDAAAQVAGTPVTETIFEVIRQARRRSSASKSVVIGHSFGALVLEKAMAQAIAGSVLAQDAQAARAGRTTFSAPADLILLVNSAAESIYAKELKDMFDGIGHRSHIDPNRPLLVSITSESDFPTAKLFRAGTFLPNLFANRRYNWGKRRLAANHDVSQNEYLTRTPGHNRRLFTHFVQDLDEPAGSSRTASRVDIRRPGACSGENKAFAYNLRQPRGMTFVTSTADEPDKFNRWSINPQPRSRPSPYWVMHVPRKIIHGHAPIFTPEGAAMMAALFNISNRDVTGARQISISDEPLGQKKESTRAEREVQPQ